MLNSQARCRSATYKAKNCFPHFQSLCVHQAITLSLSLGRYKDQHLLLCKRVCDRLVDKVRRCTWQPTLLDVCIIEYRFWVHRPVEGNHLDIFYFSFSSVAFRFRSKFHEFDMKPLCLRCHEKLPRELRKRLRKAESANRWVAGLPTEWTYFSMYSN